MMICVDDHSKVIARGETSGMAFTLYEDFIYGLVNLVLVAILGEGPGLDRGF